MDGTNFVAFQYLASGGGTNDFQFDNLADINGSIIGNGDGSDQMDFSRYTVGVAVNLPTGAGTGVVQSTSGFTIVPAFSGISVVNGADTLPNGGSTLPVNTITGPNASTTWSINGTNAGRAGGVAFTTFQNITGGTGADDFQFYAAGAFPATSSAAAARTTWTTRPTPGRLP